MQVFDVSNNMLTGGLYDIAVVPSSNASTMKASINRFSGPLSTQAIEKFVSPVSILNGNVFSCSNLPENDNDKERYSCGSQNFEYSVYYWCILFSVAVGVICFITFSDVSVEVFSIPLRIHERKHTRSNRLRWYEEYTSKQQELLFSSTHQKQYIGIDPCASGSSLHFYCISGKNKLPKLQ